MPGRRLAHAAQRFVGVDVRRRLHQLEVPAGISSTGKDYRRLPLPRARLRSEVAHDKPDAFEIGAIRAGPMEDVRVVQRHLALTEHDIDGPSFIDFRRRRMSFGMAARGSPSAAWRRSESGIARMQPLAGMLSAKAIHALAVSPLSNPM